MTSYQPKENTRLFISLIIIVILLSYIIYTTLILTKPIDNYCEYNKRCEMYNKSIRNNTKINGVFHSPYYYCVWTEGRETGEIIADDPYIYNINKTAAHELCHSFIIYDNKKHFCKK